MIDLTKLASKLDDGGQPDLADRLDRMIRSAEELDDFEKALVRGKNSARVTEQAAEQMLKRPSRLWRSLPWLFPLGMLGAAAYDTFADRPTKGTVMPQAPPGSTFDPQFQMQDVMREIMRNSHIYANPGPMPAGIEQPGQPQWQTFDQTWANRMMTPQSYGGWQG